MVQWYQVSGWLSEAFEPALTVSDDDKKASEQEEDLSKPAIALVRQNGKMVRMREGWTTGDLSRESTEEETTNSTSICIPTPWCPQDEQNESVPQDAVIQEDFEAASDAIRCPVQEEQDQENTKASEPQDAPVQYVGDEFVEVENTVLDAREGESRPDDTELESVQSVEDTDKEAEDEGGVDTSIILFHGVSAGEFDHKGTPKKPRGNDGASQTLAPKKTSR